MSYREEIQKIELTGPAACEKVSRVLIDGKYFPSQAIADITYQILKSLGFKVAA